MHQNSGMTAGAVALFPIYEKTAKSVCSFVVGLTLRWSGDFLFMLK